MNQDVKPGERHPDLGPPMTGEALPFGVVESAPPKKLEEAERLQIENLFLQMQFQQQAVENLDMRKAQIVEQMRGVQAQMEQLRDRLSAKYGVLIDRTTVRPDGTIVTSIPVGVKR